MAIATRTILVADDSSTVRAFFRRALETIDPSLTIIEASDGKACADALTNQNVDIAFVDHHMPGMTGIEAMELAQKQGRDAFVIVMSGNIDAGLIEKAKKFHAYEFLEKPFRVDDVKRVIEQHMTVKRNLSVLVVDDSRVVRRVIFKVLDESIFTVSKSEADSGKLAISLSRTIPYDIIFMDYNMPELNGLEGARQIMDIQPSARIVLMSTNETPQLVEQAKKAGLASFLKKPFYPADVDRLLHTLLGLDQPELYNPDFKDKFGPAKTEARPQAQSPKPQAPNAKPDDADSDAEAFLI